MTSVLFVVGIVGLSVAFILRTRRLTLFALGLAGITIGFGIILRIAKVFGFEWTLLSMQLLLLACFAGLTLLGWFWQTSDRAPLRKQLVAIALPIVLAAVALGAILLWAQSTYGRLFAFGFLMDKDEGRANAVWLNATSELAQGLPVTSSPLITATGVLPLLVIATSLSATWSILTSGGINEPVIAVQAVVTASFLLVAVSPLALAPIVSGRYPTFRGQSSVIRVPAQLMWLGSLILVIGSAALLSSGNIPGQLALLFLTLWIATFLASSKVGTPAVLASIAFVGIAPTFPPLVPLGFIVAILIIVQQVRVRKRQGNFQTLVMLALTLAVVWPLSTFAGVRPQSFSAPEIDVPFFALAAASVVAVGYLIQQRQQSARPLLSSVAPLIGVLIYAASFGMWGFAFQQEGFGDASQAMFFLAGVAGLASTIPIALGGLGELKSGWTVQQVVAVLIVLWVIAAGTLVTRMSNVLNFESRVASADSGLAPLAALTSQANRDPLASGMPIACLYLPPKAKAPSAYPDPDFALACTRMLISLGGRQGKVGSLPDWLDSELVSNIPLWEGWYENLAKSPPEAAQSQVLILDEQGAVIGFERFGSLVDRYQPIPAAD